MAIETIGEKLVVDIFSIVLGIIAIFAVGAVAKMKLAPSKVWNEDDWLPEELEEIMITKKCEKGIRISGSIDFLLKWLCLSNSKFRKR